MAKSITKSCSNCNHRAMLAFMKFNQFLRFFFFLMLIWVFLQVTPAHADDPLTVNDIKVDVSDQNAAVARDKAIVAGQRAAFEKLAASQNIPVPKLSDDKIANLIKDFSVQTERTSATRYVATLTYRFRQGPTRNILTSAGASLPPTEQQQAQNFQNVISQSAQPGARDLLSGGSSDEPYMAYASSVPLQAVIVPIFDRSRPMLWENPNPWRAAWQRALSQRGISDIGVPQGTIDDIQSLPPEEAVAMNPSALNNFRTRYQAQAVWVFRAGLSNGGQNQPQLTVAFSRLDPSGQSAIDSFALDGRYLASQDQLLDAGVAEALKRMGVASTNAALSSAGNASGSVKATAAITGLQDITNVQQKLSSTGLFTGIDILSVSPQAIKLDLKTSYDTNTLRDRLAASNIRLTQTDTGEIQLGF